MTKPSPPGGWFGQLALLTAFGALYWFILYSVIEGTRDTSIGVWQSPVAGTFYLSLILISLLAQYVGLAALVRNARGRRWIAGTLAALIISGFSVGAFMNYWVVDCYAFGRSCV